MSRLKKVLIVFILLIVLFLISAYAYNGDTLVYVTRTGECYHRDGCSYLKSRIEITLEDAVNQGYRPCSRCNPPILGEDRSTDDNNYVRSNTSSSTSTSHSSSSISTSKPAKSSNVGASIANSSASESFSWAYIILGVVGLLIGSFAANIKRKKDLQAVQNQSDKKIQALQAETQALKSKMSSIDMQKSQMSNRIQDLEKQLYQERFANRDIHQLSNAPEDSEIGSDGLPRLKRARNLWGRRYTRYISRTGETYHKDKGCCNAHIPVNVYSIYKQSDPSVKGLRPCRRCNPTIPDLIWVDKWLELSPSKDSYGLEQFRIKLDS